MTAFGLIRFDARLHQRAPWVWSLIGGWRPIDGRPRKFGANFKPENGEARIAVQEALDLLTLVTWKSEVAGDELFFLALKEGESAYHGQLTAIRSASDSSVKLNGYYDEPLWPKSKKTRKKSAHAKSGM